VADVEYGAVLRTHRPEHHLAAVEKIVSGVPAVAASDAVNAVELRRD
jgi:hypothetical protein